MLRAIAIVFVALTLGLGWAVRGHFGHEWGAAWAGAIAGLAVVVISRRPDWTAKAPVLGAAAAVGWAVGGMMSYGQVVGYCRGTHLLDVYYGYLMLAVIGGLYGFIGGGLLGLELETTDKHRPDWLGLITRMVAGAMLAWGLLIYQLEWLMTPPRSELWAACLGAAAALAWYCHQKGFRLALRVALHSALGAGFGFAFGNFLQIMGNVTGISINWWNVMEFTLGTCGGLGMAYAIFTCRWPVGVRRSRVANGLALLFLFAMIPAINIQQAFDQETLVKLAAQAGLADPGMFALEQRLGAALLTLTMLMNVSAHWYYGKRDERIAISLLVTASLLYIMFSHFRKGVIELGFASQPEQIAYWVVFALAGLIAAGRWQIAAPIPSEPRTGDEEPPASAALEGAGYYGVLILLPITLCGLFAWISIHSHGELPGTHSRFWPG
jgi:hypothetical protein